MASWRHERLLREDLRRKIVQALRRGTPKSEAARAFGASRSSVKRYANLADEGRPLAPKKRPGSKPKMGEDARRLLEAAASKSARPPLLPTGASSWGRSRGFG